MKWGQQNMVRMAVVMWVPTKELMLCVVDFLPLIKCTSRAYRFLVLENMQHDSPGSRHQQGQFFCGVVYFGKLEAAPLQRRSFLRKPMQVSTEALMPAAMKIKCQLQLVDLVCSITQSKARY